MKRQIELQSKKVEYTLKISRRARRMRLAVYCGGDFVVTAPQSMGQSIIEQFIIEKSQWIINKIDYFKRFPAKILTKNGKRDYLKYKENALALAESRINYFNKQFGFLINTVNIKNQKTRWGSCSRKGNLNFNYKIALLPPQFAAYIIVHELCHLGEFNHSRRFWNLVAKMIPNYREIRNELKERGKIF